MNKSAADLAGAVIEYFRKRGKRPPPERAIRTVFETMFAASLRKEEGQPITFHIAYLDPSRPDPHPPKYVRRDRWITVPFAAALPMTTSNLVKLAKASDPRTSSIAIYHSTRGVELWGLIDQGNSHHRVANFDREGGFARPGRFQASIAGVGHLVAYDGFLKIAELRVDTLVTAAIDVFGGGPVRQLLQPAIKAVVEGANASAVAPLNGIYEYLEDDAKSDVIASLCRILLRIQSFGHGGALLITPDSAAKNLKIKYGIQYPRLRDSLSKRISTRAEKHLAWEEIDADYLDERADTVPASLYLQEVVSADELRDSDDEVDGAVWFISLLTRVDGLVLLTPDLQVRGFGVEIAESAEPSSVYRARSRTASHRQLRVADYQHFGTRHRSMMRYVHAVPGSLGFVVSQDGDVRAVANVRGRTVLWEDIKLQFYSFAPAHRLAPWSGSVPPVT